MASDLDRLIEQILAARDKFARDLEMVRPLLPTGPLFEQQEAVQESIRMATEKMRQQQAMVEKSIAPLLEGQKEFLRQNQEALAKVLQQTGDVVRKFEASGG